MCQDYESLVDVIKSFYSMKIETRENSLKGWNWGEPEFQGNTMQFMIGSKPAFEIPLDLVGNTVLQTKNEVNIEFVSNESTLDGKKVKDDILVEIKYSLLF